MMSILKVSDGSPLREGHNPVSLMVAEHGSLHGLAPPIDTGKDEESKGVEEQREPTACPPRHYAGPSCFQALLACWRGRGAKTKDTMNVGITMKAVSEETLKEDTDEKERTDAHFQEEKEVKVIGGTVLALGLLAAAEEEEARWPPGAALGSPPQGGSLGDAPGPSALPPGTPSPDPLQEDDQKGALGSAADRALWNRAASPHDRLLRSGGANGAFRFLTRTATPRASPPADTPCGRQPVTPALGSCWEALFRAQVIGWRCICFGRACPQENRNQDSPNPRPGSASHASVSSLLEQRGSQPELGRAASHLNAFPPGEKAAIAASLHLQRTPAAHEHPARGEGWSAGGDPHSFQGLALYGPPSRPWPAPDLVETSSFPLRGRCGF